MIRVMIADDTLIAREGWKTILDTVEDIVVVEEATVAQEILPKMTKSQPDMLLLDLKWFSDEQVGESLPTAPIRTR